MQGMQDMQRRTDRPGALASDARRAVGCRGIPTGRGGRAEPAARPWPRGEIVRASHEKPRRVDSGFSCEARTISQPATPSMSFCMPCMVEGRDRGQHGVRP
jgi:hypothetical protein